MQITIEGMKDNKKCQDLLQMKLNVVFGLESKQYYIINENREILMSMDAPSVDSVCSPKSSDVIDFFMKHYVVWGRFCGYVLEEGSYEHYLRLEINDTRF